MNAVFLGLLLLLTEPSYEEPLNLEAGELLGKDPAEFASTVRHTMAGAKVDGVQYDCVLSK